MISRSWTVGTAQPRLGTPAEPSRAVSSAKQFSIWEDALNYARELIRAGDEVRIISSDGETLDHKAVLFRIAKTQGFTSWFTDA